MRRLLRYLRDYVDGLYTPDDVTGNPWPDCPCNDLRYERGHMETCPRFGQPADAPIPRESRPIFPSWAQQPEDDAFFLTQPTMADDGIDEPEGIHLAAVNEGMSLYGYGLEGGPSPDPGRSRAVPWSDELERRRREEIAELERLAEEHRAEIRNRYAGR